MFTQTWAGVYDVWTVVQKEFKDVAAATGLSALRILVTACVLGIGGGWVSRGLGYVWYEQPLLLVLWLLLPIPLVIVAVSESFAGERERNTLETLLATRLSTQSILMGKTIAATLFGWLASLLVLLTCFLTQRLIGAGELDRLGYLEAGSALAGVGLLVALFTACVGVLVSQNAAKVSQARASHSLALALIVLGAILLMVLFAQWWPGFVQISLLVSLSIMAVVLLIADLGLYATASLRFSRARLLAQ